MVRVRPFRPEDVSAVLKILRGGYSEEVVPMTRRFVFNRRSLTAVSLILAVGARWGIQQLNDHHTKTNLLITLIAGLGLGSCLVVGVYRGVKRDSLRRMEKYWANCLQEDLGDISGFYSKPGNRFIVAENTETKEVVGCCGLCDPPSSPLTEDFAADYAGISKGVKRAEIRRMSVLPAYQSQGVGRLLMNDLLAFARQCGYEEVVLFVDVTQVKAQRFYVRHGFQLVGVSSRKPPQHPSSILYRWPFQFLLNDLSAPYLIYTLPL